MYIRPLLLRHGSLDLEEGTFKVLAEDLDSTALLDMEFDALKALLEDADHLRIEITAPTFFSMVWIEEPCTTK